MPLSYSKQIYSRAPIQQLGQLAIVALLLMVSLPLMAQGDESIDSGDADTAQSVENDIAANMPKTELEHMELLAASLDPAEILWQGEEQQRFIGLHRVAVNPGENAILLLPNRARQLAQPNIMREIYLDLPEFGWSVLNIVLPYAALEPLPTRVMGTDSASAEQTAGDASTLDNGDENTAASDTGQVDAADPQADRDDPEDTARQRIKTSTEFLVEQGARDVTLVTEINNVARAIAVAVDNSTLISGIILWRVDNQHLDAEQLTQLAQLGTRVLDIVDQGSTPRAKRQRARLFNMAGFNETYRLIAAPAENAGIPYASRRIRHWLSGAVEEKTVEATTE